MASSYVLGEGWLSPHRVIGWGNVNVGELSKIMQL